jgi:hypothetical protein
MRSVLCVACGTPMENETVGLAYGADSVCPLCLRCAALCLVPADAPRFAHPPRAPRRRRA